MQDTEMQNNAAKGDYDVLVIGAGVGGLYALHKLRGEGYRVHVL